jgi:cytochrome c556
MNKKTLTVAAVVSALTIGVAFAHGGATGIVKERMDGMMAMGKALATVADMFKGKTSYTPAKVAASADIVAGHALEMKKLFPDTKASRQGKGTEALPLVWQNLEEFMALADQLADDATQLKRLAETGSQQDVRAAFGKVAKNCSACHRDYRKPKS